MNQTIEQQTADAILQTPITVTIGGVQYNVARPTTATLIRVSELVSKLPSFQLDKDNVLMESLMIAKDCGLLGEIAAVLVLGAQRNAGGKKTSQKGLFAFFNKKDIQVAELSEMILFTMSPKELNALIIDLLTGMEISDFFGLTTSLLEVNLLRRTKEVVN